MARTDLLFDVAHNDIVVENGGINNSILEGTWQGDNLTFTGTGDEFYVTIPYNENRSSNLKINGKTALGYMYGKKELIKPYQLPVISVNGVFFVRKEDNKYVIYSADGSDFSIGAAKAQNTSLLLICKPGNSYRYPTAGVNLRKYVNSSVHSNREMADRIIDEFSRDNVSVLDADYDMNTGKLNITSEENK